MNSGVSSCVDISSGSYGLAVSGRMGLRLALKPKTALTGAVDGVWWPRTTNPLAEFPAMIAGVELYRRPVDRMAFSPIAWDDAPDRIVVAGATIELEGIRSLDRSTVWVSGVDRHCVVLLVIPPGTNEREATAMLAANGHDSDQARQIMVAGGVDRRGGVDDRG
jgi:hypothetical protein